MLGFMAIAALLVACEKDSKMEGCEDLRIKTVELNKCAEKATADGTPEVCFTELNDSRCPINADCVWQGVAIAKFTLKADGTQHQITLATTKIAGFPSTDTTVSGYNVKLLNVTPYPGSTTPEPTRAILQITR